MVMTNDSDNDYGYDYDEEKIGTAPIYLSLRATERSEAILWTRRDNLDCFVIRHRTVMDSSQ